MTIREVAAAAGVHLSTVSRALDPQRRHLVSQDVLTAVESAAQALGYRPNRAASALRTGRSHTIGVLLPDITNPVFPPILQGIEAAAAARGYFVLVANASAGPMAQAIVQRMHAHQVDGVLLATATRADPLVDHLLAAGIQAVLVNRADEDARLPAVVSDDRLAMRLAVEHLLAAGCTRLAHLAGPQHLPTGVARRQGFEQALRDRGHAAVVQVECSAYSREAGAEAGRRLLAQAAPSRLDGIVCSNDLVALGCYDALREAGLRIGRDVAVTGHNDMPLVDMVEPPLTTIRLPHREMGWRAAELLFERLAARGQALAPATLVLRPELVVRASSQRG